MKILHISYKDSGGGAANAALSLHRSLLQAGVDSRMLVIKKSTDNPTIQTAWRGWRWLRWWIGKKSSKVVECLQRDGTASIFSSNLLAPSLLKWIDRISPDLVHLHWVGSDTLPLSDLAAIKCPIVWTLHDMWPFCGAEHLALPWKGDRWRYGYPPESRTGLACGIDLNRLIWNQKSNHWRGLGIHCVASSDWMLDSVNLSRLSKMNVFLPAKKISGAVDSTVFYKENKNNCRDHLRLPRNATILCFGAHDVGIETKGLGYLMESLEKLDTSTQITLLTFGSGKMPQIKTINYWHLGNINDPAMLRRVYSASDLFLMPSLIESFGLVAAESMACGTPVVCYDTTGLKDVVDHQITGYRAQLFDTDDFADGIQWCLSDLERLRQLGETGERKVRKSFSVDQARNAYIELYAEALTKTVCAG